MTNAATNEAQKQKQQPGERTPIPVELLLISHANPHGVRLPQAGGANKLEHQVIAGENGDIKTEIDFLPWMRRYRVTRYTREGANEKETWRPHKPFYIPESWAVHVEAE